MQAYTADDFISADLTVTKLVAVTHSCSPAWARPTAFPRTYDGILYFASGCIEYYYGDKTFTAREGMVLKLPKGVPYNGRQMTDAPVDVYYCDFMSPGTEFADFPIPYVYYPSDGEAVRRAFEDILETWERRSVCSALEAKNATARLLCDMARDVAVSVCGYGDRSRIIAMCEYIAAECVSPDFSVGTAAEHFHMSEAHLRRIFAAELHTSPIAYITNARIELAKSKLVGRADKTVGEIAALCGFSGVYYFSSAFKRITGETPTEYRRRMTGSVS